MHGGATPVGPASPHYRHGRYSKLLPKGLSERYAVAVSDPHLVELVDEIALMDVRIGAVMSRLNQSGGAHLWTKAQQSLRTFRDAGQDKKKLATARQALAELQAAIDAGTSEAAGWDQLVALIEQRRKLVDTESKRMKDLHAMVSVDRVMALVAYVTDTVRRNVKDREALTAIFADLRKVLKPGDTNGG